MMLLFAGADHRFDDMERQAETPRELSAGELAREVERLEDQLRDQVAREPGLRRAISAPGSGATRLVLR